MAQDEQDERERRCEYCWRFEAQEHLDSCPVSIGTQEAKTEWERGWQTGFHYGPFEPWEMSKNGSPQFRLGVRIGSDEIEELIQRALARNHGEYDW